MFDTPVLQLRAVTRSFIQGSEKLDVLRGVDLTIKRGEIVALVGESGSGKSTLLQIAGLLDTPTSGEVIIGGVNASKANDDERTRLRLKNLGFVYQFHHLLPEFSARENIAVPQMIAGITYDKAVKHADEMLATLGLAARGSHRPGALSGGEQQRVAIARALAGGPALILADEPTGNLDPDMSESVFQMFLSLARSRGLAALVATHNLDLARRMDRVVTMKGGRVE
jgi:lipoprotein-releasing system ATP-binding protein